MAKYRASVTCVSGGMDSAVTASEAARDSDALYFLHVNYGQRTEARELDCFQRLCDHYGVRERLVAELPHLARIGGSSLVDARIPVEPADLSRRRIPSSYVPFRNTQILAAAVSWAEALGRKPSTSAPWPKTVPATPIAGPSSTARSRNSSGPAPAPRPGSRWSRR